MYFAFHYLVLIIIKMWFQDFISELKFMRDIRYLKLQQQFLIIKENINNTLAF